MSIYKGKPQKKSADFGIFLTEILIDPFFFSESRRNINRPPKIFLNFSPIWVLRGGLLIVIPWYSLQNLPVFGWFSLFLFNYCMFYCQFLHQNCIPKNWTENDRKNDHSPKWSLFKFSDKKVVNQQKWSIILVDTYCISGVRLNDS